MKIELSKNRVYSSSSETLIVRVKMHITLGSRIPKCFVFAEELLLHEKEEKSNLFLHSIKFFFSTI